MPTAAPPPISPEKPEPALDPEALIEEARSRQRRRRRRWSVVVAAAIVTGLGILALHGGSTPATSERGGGGPTVDIAAFAGHGRLAFISRNTVWVLDGDHPTSLRQIATPRGLYPLQPSFSPDGRWLAFVDTSTRPSYVAGGGAPVGRLWLARGDGTDARPVAGLADARLVGWSPSSDLLAVVAGPVSTRVPFGVDTTVRLLTPDRAVRRLVAARYVRGAVWSPDGKQLAVVTEDTRLHDTLATYPIDGGRRAIWKRFAPHTHLDGMTQILVDPAGWWPGVGIGLWVFGDGMTHNNDATPLDVVASPGAAPRFLAETLSDRTTRVVASSAGRLAVVADVSHGINGGRLVWDAKQLQVCTSRSPCTPIVVDRRIVSLDPAWSPNGEELAFVEAPDLISSGWPPGVLERWYADHRLGIFNLRARTVRTVASARGATVPLWSPDGRSLLFVDRNGIWLLPRVGAKPVEIASPLFAGSWPAYFGQTAWPAQFAWSSR